MKKLLLPFSSQSGISLLEVLVSLMMLGFILFIVVNLPQATRLIGSSRHESIAKDIVVQQVERLRSQSYDNLALGSSTISDNRLSTLPAASSSIVISNCPNTICTNGEQTKMVEVKVSWQEESKVKQVDVITLISKGGLL